MRSLPLPKVYQLLEPGPVVLLATARGGYANIMTMSWHMMIEFEPPQVACVVSGNNFSFAALSETGECVIAIPARRLARKVVQVGNSSGRTVDKFEKFGLTKLPAMRVKPPLIAECFANLECKVTDRRLVKRLQSVYPRSAESLDRSNAEEARRPFITAATASSWRTGRTSRCNRACAELDLCV